MQQPNTKTVVSYVYKITGAGGEVIGTLQGFNPSFNRTLERVRELGNVDVDMLEIVAGRGEFTITLDRLETYSENFAKALGLSTANVGGVGDGSAGVIPSNQKESFTIVETISNLTNSRSIIYGECWIQSYFKTIREGTVLVTESVTIWPTSVTLGPTT